MYVAIASRCLEETFSLTGEEGRVRTHQGGRGVQIPRVDVGPVRQQQSIITT